MPSVYSTVFGGSLVAPAIPTYLALSISASIVLGWPLESNITSPAAAEIIDVTATVGGLTIQLSDARQISTGYCALFNNVGANTVTVLDAQGNTLMAPASGQAWQLYLADNSTLQGTWRVFQYGASVSTANAASLAGNGLKAISSLLNERISINTQAVNYTIQNSDRAACVEWTGGSGGTLTAPAPATVGADWFCYIKNSGTGVVTLSPTAGVIDGVASKAFNPNDSCVLVSDGTNLFTMGFGQSVASAFNFVTISLAGAPATVTLAGAQLNRISYKFTGALTNNVTVVVPASIQQYWVDNETTGAFTLTISAGGSGSTFVAQQGSRNILYCDGLNIVNAVSGSGSSTVLVADGSAAAPGLAWASDTQMGLYKVGTDILGISTAGTARSSTDSIGRWVINASGSGITFVINANATAAALKGIGSGAGVEVLQLDNSAGDTRLGFYSAATEYGLLQANTNAFNFSAIGASTVLRLAVNSGTAVQIAPTGNVTINAPSSGVTVTANGLANNNAVLINGSSTGGQSLGLGVVAGTTSADYGILVFNQAATLVCFKVRGDGVVLGNDGTNQFELGYKDLPVNNQSGGNYTLVASDRGKSITCGNGFTYTIPNSVFGAGAAITFEIASGSTCTIAQGAGITLAWAGNGAATGNRTLTGAGVATVVFGGTTTTPYITGAGLS